MVVKYAFNSLWPSDFQGVDARHDARRIYMNLPISRVEVVTVIMSYNEQCRDDMIGESYHFNKPRQTNTKLHKEVMHALITIDGEDMRLVRLAFVVWFMFQDHKKCMSVPELMTKDTASMSFLWRWSTAIMDEVDHKLTIKCSSNHLYQNRNYRLCTLISCRVQVCVCLLFT